MTRKNGKFVTVSSCFMEICWMYSLSSFCLNAVTNRPFPLSTAVSAFIVPALLTHLTTGKGWRAIYTLLVHAAAFPVVGLLNMHAVHFRSYGLLDTAWFSGLLGFAKSPSELLYFLSSMLFMFFFWIGGTLFAKRKLDYYKICGRFDIGLAVLFCIFIFTLILSAKGGVDVHDPTSSACIYPFFLSGLVAMGAGKNGKLTGRFVPGFKGIGVVITAIAGVLLISAAIIFLFLPALRTTADAGYSLIRIGGGFIMPYVVSILRFLFSPGSLREEPAVSSSGDRDFVPSVLSTNGPRSGFDILFSWSVKVFLIALFLIAAAFALWFIVRRLLKKTPPDPGRNAGKFFDMHWFFRLIAFMKSSFAAVLRKAGGRRTAVELYSVLRTWGRRCGVRHCRNETAFEYGSRLRMKFPVLSMHIGTIIDAYNMEVYGRAGISVEMFESAKESIRTMKSPNYWPMRFRHAFGSREK